MEPSQFQEYYLKNPVKFSENIFGVKLWDKQVDIMNSVRDNQSTVVQSCYGSGKSFDAAQIALWFAYTHVPSKVIITSSSWNQVEKIIFAELAGAYKRAKVPLGGRLLATELTIEKDWFIIGVSPQINVDSEAYRFEGFHSPHVLVILDQAQGINPKLWDVATALVTGESSRILVLGNPTSPSGKFYEACTKLESWHKIKISAFDVPNVKEGKEVIPGLVTKQWVENRKEEWGEGSPLYLSKVLATFPVEGSDILIPLATAEAAIDRKFEVDSDSIGMGVDVARFGNDLTVLDVIKGDRLIDIVAYQGKDLMKTCGQVIRLMNKHNIPAKCVFVDDTGVGGGVTDRLHEEGHLVVPINNGEKAIDNIHFFNRGAEVYWAMKEKFDNESISIPNSPMLLSQLSSRKYLTTSKGQIKLESKDNMRKRGVKSPDYADALALAIAAQGAFAVKSSGPNLTVIG